MEAFGISSTDDLPPLCEGKELNNSDYSNCSPTNTRLCVSDFWALQQADIKNSDEENLN